MKLSVLLHEEQMQGLSRTKEAMIGNSFGNYRIEQKLGEGGMGVVYLAVDKDLERRVALKTLVSGSDQDEELVSRFLREAKAASRLQHPSIVTLYHFGLEGTTRYMVMEYIEGQTLRKVIGNKPLETVRLLDYAIQVTDGIALAHDNGVIHRDLKAENIMITTRGQVKILDFGLAKLKAKAVSTDDDVTDFRTQFGMVVGTVTTMSPEQAMGKEVDSSSDVFSLGVIFYQMATGKLPFEGPTAQATMALILNQEPVPVTHHNPDVPPALAQLIEHCLQKTSVFRPSAREILTKLKNIQAGQSGAKIPVSEVRSSTVAPVLAPPTPDSGRMVPVPAPSDRMKAPSGVAMPATAAQVSSRKSVYYAIRTARIALAIATLTVPLAYLLYFVILGGVIRAQAVEGTWLMSFMQTVVTPALAFTDRVFTFRAVVNNWNFLLLGIAVIAFIVRYLLLLPVTAAEHWAKTRMVTSRAAAPQVAAVSVSEGASAPRLALLREYAEAKKVLFEDKKLLAFYSLEIAGVAKMRSGQDQLVVEHAFAEFKKYVDRILELNGCWKSSWNPDGVLCAFRDAEAGVKAAQEVLRGLDWFNDGVHALAQKFRVRSGMHCGEVVFPEHKGIPEVSDLVIDVATHVQKQCSENALWVTAQVTDSLATSGGFNLAGQEVDGCKVYTWNVEAKEAAPSRA